MSEMTGMLHRGERSTPAPFRLPEVPRRAGRRVALLARYPERDPAMPQFIPNLGVYMIEAALRASALPELEVKLWDITGDDAGRIAAEVIAFDPDVVGCSVFLWSFGFFLEVAEALKADDPGRLIVFGGPSARPVMLDHQPHRMKSGAVDLLVINEGENTFREVVDLDRSFARRADGHSGRGVARGRRLARNRGAAARRPQSAVIALRDGPDAAGGLGILQTYRGCPFTCSFCEWGTMESPKRVRTVESLSAEFAAMERMGLGGALLADAGLNLNSGAFRNLSDRRQKNWLPRQARTDLRGLSGQGAGRASRFSRRHRPALCRRRLAVLRQQGACQRRAQIR